MDSTRRWRWMRTYLGHLVKRRRSRLGAGAPPRPAHQDARAGRGEGAGAAGNQPQREDEHTAAADCVQQGDRDRCCGCAPWAGPPKEGYPLLLLVVAAALCCGWPLDDTQLLAPATAAAVAASTDGTPGATATTASISCCCCWRSEAHPWGHRPDCVRLQPSGSQVAGGGMLHPAALLALSCWSKGTARAAAHKPCCCDVSVAALPCTNSR